MSTFNELGLAEPILKALAHEGYDAPTPIQAQAIPHVLRGKDLLGIAQTGTGKTAAFALPILNHLELNRTRRVGRRACRVLVLSPTRELAGQILDSFRAYGRFMKVTSALAIGGVPVGRQARSLMPGVDVLVATPGRVIDLYEQGAIKFDEIEILVLDEADRMLEVGFVHAIRSIIAKLPEVRQGLFFSATMPKEIADLAERLLREPATVSVTPVAKTADLIEQRVLFIDQGAKGRLLADVLTKEPIDRAIVFTRTKHGADRVVRGLAGADIAAEAIHGNKSQGQRERALQSFRQGRVKILVATDIAARGIDVDGVSHVVNYDLPNVPESYVHRIGRTGRAGASGIAISFCSNDERDDLKAIEKLIRQRVPLGDSNFAELKPDPRPAPGEVETASTGNGGGRNRGGQRQRGPQQPGGFRNGGRGQGQGRSDGGNRPPRREGGELQSAPAGERDGRRDGHSGSARPNAGRPHGAGRSDGGRRADDLSGVRFLSRKPREERGEGRHAHHDGNH
ncbi:ATP-dependent RNA helicase RhlE [Pseudoxanthobacter soli DSM 19599]|uniref:DEAD-box ATP-dependent RNA helicase RhpA n=1 Tax=Pseudoxanthobacter soli DSM 19599 TaxID=1123029 RepID=A0A1M7ZLP6_9HYPH|nr:DEAD/DEAH box helicase [Pseudoxanthobacter soli]SHO65729.1 ATP-dependent RNA helicase RhlE [Pseudoxanthobacter soli DSM 19599]